MFAAHNTNPKQVATHADRLTREQAGSRMVLIFFAVTAVSLGVMTTKMVLDTFRDHRREGKKYALGR